MSKIMHMVMMNKQIKITENSMIVKKNTLIQFNRIFDFEVNHALIFLKK